MKLARRHSGFGSRSALAVVTATILATAGSAALADPQRLPVDELKSVYLACDHAASQTLLDRAAAAFCSRYAEELLKRGFAGDFNMLLAWWREAKEQAIVANEERPDGAPEQAN